MIWDVINTIVNIIISFYSVLKNKNRIECKNTASEEQQLSYLADLLESDNNNQHLIAINKLYNIAQKNESYIQVICELLCSQIKRINTLYVYRGAGCIEQPFEVQKILELLFSTNGIFENEQKDLQDTIFVNWKLGNHNKIKNVNFSGCRFVNCIFQGVTLYNCKMSHIVIQNCSFKNSTELNKCLLNEAQINSDTLFRNVVIKDSTLIGAKIKDVNFVRTDLGNSIFYNSEVSDSHFTHCITHQCDFTFTQFKHTSLIYPNTILMGTQTRYFDSLDLPYTTDVSSNIIAF